MFSPTVQITLPDTMSMRDSDGTVYTAKQMHFHWGGRDSEISGSEHTIDGMRHAIEVRNKPDRVPFLSSSRITFLCASVCKPGVTYVHFK